MRLSLIDFHQIIFTKDTNYHPTFQNYTEISLTIYTQTTITSTTHMGLISIIRAYSTNTFKLMGETPYNS